jgi:hypothetical protein
VRSKNMKKLLLAAVIACSAWAVGCSDDDAPAPVAEDTGTADTGTTPTDTGTDTGTEPTDTGSETGGFPAPPTLGMQIDRMGRPAINTATNHTFDTNDTTKNAAKDAWNQAAPATWNTFVPEIEKNLAIIDAIDGTCGNQAFADTTKTNADRYKTLAGVLADDRLWLKSDATTCTVYLAVEANATKFVENMDCGGRRPDYDVMKESYSLLAAGALAGVTDGVVTPDRAKVMTFPYMDAPH